MDIDKKGRDRLTEKITVASVPGLVIIPMKKVRKSESSKKTCLAGWIIELIVMDRVTNM